MKKLITSMIGTGLLLSCNAFAFTPECGNCGYGSGLCAPKYPGGFYIGVTGAYVQPTASNIALNSLVFQFANADGDLLRSEARRFDFDHEWAWGFNAGYDLPCTSYNLELTYFHFNNTERHNADLVPADIASVGSFFFPDLVFPVVDSIADLSALTPIALTDLFAANELRYKFDQVDLRFGRQYNDVCGHFQIKPSIGVRYARIDHNYRSDVAASLVDLFGLQPIITGIPTPFIDANLASGLHSKFDGTGPMLSLDARYGFGCGGFGIVGHFDGALLVGNVNTETSIVIDTINTATAGGAPVAGSETTTIERFHTPTTDRLVTNFTGKIGVDYSFCFCNKSSLTIEVGYQANKFYDAIDLIRGDIFVPTSVLPLVAIVPPITVPVPINQTAQRITDTTSNNFDIRGPYVNVTYHL